MGKPKKNGTYLNVCIDTAIYDELTSLCEDVGKTKIIAVERALTDYLEDYKRSRKH